MLILLDPAGLHGREALEVTLIALLSRKTLLIDEQRCLRLASPEPTGLAREEAAVVDVVRSTLSFDAAPITVFQRQARSAFGVDLNGFDRDLVRPELLRRGLLIETRRRNWLGAERRPCELTLSGEAERRRIHATMQRLRSLHEIGRRDPAEAASIARSAGAALFLLPEVGASYLQALRGVRDRRQSRDGGFADLWISSDSGGADFWSDWGGGDGDGGDGDGGDASSC